VASVGTYQKTAQQTSQSSSGTENVVATRREIVMEKVV
jgi:hypothetical protein